MALGSIVIDLLMRTGAFETDSKKAEQRLKEMKKTAVDVGTVIGTAIAGGVTVATAAIVGWTREITELSEQTRILSGLSGTTSTMFQEWAIGAQTVGIEQDKLADILKDVQDKVGDFIQTGGGPLADFFEQIAPKIGLTAEQLARMSGPDALQAYVSALESANISQSEMTFYMEAIASDSSKLIPLLADGGREMRGWGDAAREAGAVMSDDMIAALRESQKEIDKLALAYRGTKIEVVQGVTPAIQDFTDLLNDSDTREGLSTLAGGLVTIATKALEAATAIGKLMGRYTEFLSNRGFIPTDNDSTMAQLEARRTKLTGALGKTDGYIGRLLYGEKTAAEIREELAQVEQDIAGFAFRGVRSRTATTAGRDGPVGTRIDPNGDKPKPKQLTEAEKEAERLLSAYESMNARLAEQISLHGQTGEAAKVRYEIEHGALAALDPLRKQALVEQAEWKDWLEEMAEIEAVWGDAATEQTKRVIDSWAAAKDEMSVYAEQAGRNMQDAFADFLFDPFKDGLSGMLENFANILKRMAAEAAAAKIFESLGAAGNANTGTWWGDMLSGLFGAQAKGKATGGYISGPGTGTSDSIPAYLSNGEYVINAAAVSKYGASFFDGLNAKRFAAGGYVGNAAPAMGAPAFNVNIHNAPGGAEVQQRRNSSGGIDLDVIFRQIEGSIANNIGQGASPINSAIQNRYNMRPAV